MMIVIETDHNAYTEDTKSQRKIQMAEEMREAAGEDEQVLCVWERECVWVSVRKRVGV